MTLIDIRELKVGEKLDNIPLVACPVCGKTSFTLGNSFSSLYGEPHDAESFAHVVENLTKTSGQIVEFCDYFPDKKKK